MTWNSARFVRALEQEMDLQQVWDAVQATAPREPYVPPDLMVLEVSGRQECSLEPLWGPYRWITEETFVIFEQDSTSSGDKYFPFERQLLTCYCVLVETMLDNGPSGY